MNLILEKTNQTSYFSNMREVLAAAGIVAEEYDWYISDIETNFTAKGFSWENQWMTGQELTFLIQQHELQFIWAVFSAVPKGLRPFVSIAPFVQGNSEYWIGKEQTPQLNGALFEIACWDSSATLLINLPEQAQRSFINTYSDTRPLSEATRR